MKRQAGEQTLFASVILSSPGPLVMGIGLLVGNSASQLADFIRRTAELAAIIISWRIFRITNKSGYEDINKKEKLEGIAKMCVGCAMCFGGILMLLIAFFIGGAPKGNVLPGFIIAILGVAANSWLWFRYRGLNKVKPNAILAVQSKLYSAKFLVDICVSAALASLLFFQGSLFSFYMDKAGSVVVAAYLLFCGAGALRKQSGK